MKKADITSDKLWVNNNTIFIVVITIILIFHHQDSSAKLFFDDNPIQINPISVEQKKFFNALFIEFMSKSESSIHTISEDRLFIRTNSSLMTKMPVLSIINIDNQLIKQFVLKTDRDGADDFFIDLNKHNIAFLENQIYRLEVEGSFNKKQFAYVKRVSKLYFQEPDADILYNALSVSCESDGAVVDFFGSIVSGVPPFNYMWMVYEEPLVSPIYQPVVGTLINSGNVPGITIDRPLGYTVVFAVRDMCGNYVEKQLHVECGDDNNYGNTIFLKSIPSEVGQPAKNEIK